MSDLDLSQLLADLSTDKRALLELLLDEEGVDLAAAVIVPRDWGSADAPLSFAQRRLWLTDRLEPGSSAYNMPFAFRLLGRLDLAALERAADEIAARHEVLRTTFPSRPDGEPVQRVAAPLPVGLPLIDLTVLAGPVRDREARRIAGEEAARAFDLAAGPLLRLSVVRLAGEDHLVMANMHHIVSDGWSIGIFVREMGALYDAFAAGRPSPLAPLPIQYRDFAHWQAEYLDAQRLEDELAYWRERLAGAPPLLELPTDRPRAAGGAGPAGSVEVAVPEPVVQGLRRIAASAGTTLFAALLAGFQEILHRWSGQEDVVVGTPSAGRDRVETEALIGFFVQTLVLRTDLGGDPVYRELVRRCSEVVLGAQSHQDLPFEMLVEELRPDRSHHQAPVFQVMFSLENTPREGPRLPGLALVPVEVESPAAKFDLILTCREGEAGDLRAGLVYDRNLFEPATVRRMLGHLERLLAGAAADPDRPVSGLPWLSEEERREILGWNATATPFPREATIHGLFAGQAAARPQAVALRFGDEEVSYGELARQAGQVALYLRGLGVGPESRVGVCLERSVEVVAVFLGILEAGGAYVPLDPAYPAERLRFLIADSGVEWLLTRGDLLAGVDVPCTVVHLEEVAAEIAALAPGAPMPESYPESLAYVMYTSGSTGTPKGVGVTHRNVVRLVRETNFARLGPDEVFLLMAPLSFDASTLELWAPLLNGGTLAILEPGSPTLEALEAALHRHGVTALWLTAGLFHLVVDERLETLRPLRQLLAGGDVLSPAHVARVLRGLPELRLINGYGPTENTTFTCTHPVTLEDAAGSVPIGRPIANTTVHLLDRNLRPVPVGVTGELYTGGEGLARCYLGRPGLTAERFVPDPFGAAGSRLYRTGDLARFLPDGRVEFLGRRDGQVKLRGIRVELGEIEAALNRCPGVRESVVVVRGEGAADKLLAAYVVPAEEGVSASSLRDHLAGRLPAALVPSAFVLLPELPLTPNGKVDRRALPEPAPERHAEDTEPAEGEVRSPVEEIVAGLFAEVLDLEEVGLEESFFELGGHSLRATQIVSRLRQSLGVELPLRSLFEEPTPAGLAALVEQELSAARMAAAPPLARVDQRTGPQPLSFAQQRLWLLDRLEPGSATYNIPSAWRLRGSLNVAALAGSLDGIVARHEVLRTRFASVAGEPVQIVAPAAPVPLPVVDLGALAEERRGGELARLAQEEARRPFDLERDLMLRATLIRLGEGDHAALFTVHHIAGDGWSLGVFIRELGELYRALDAGRPADLPELPVQYADFAAWQRSWMSGEVLAADLSWWRERLSALPPVLELPVDRPRPAVQSYRGATVARELPEELGASLRALARRQGATLFMVLLAGFESLLYRMTSQEAFAVGTPVAGRTRVELEPLIGFFVNTLALPARVEGDESFGGLLQRVREVALEAYARQQIPFEMLVDELHPQRTLSYSPVFQVLFALQNAPLRSRRSRGLSGLELSALAQDTGTAKFDLSLIVSEGRRLTATLEIAADLFEPATARRMLGHLEHLLAGAVAGPDQRVSDLPWLSEEERQEILVAWNATATPFPREATIHGLFAEQAAARPQAVALRFRDEEVRYGELAGRVAQMALYLRGLGVGPESRVGVCLERSVEVVVVLLGILEAGGAYVPLDPAYPAERLRYLVADSGVEWVLTRGSLLAGVEVPCTVVLLEEVAEEIASLPRIAPATAPCAESLAYVIYTSGSTGRPKGVGVTHRNVVRLVRETDYMRMGPDEVFLLMVPLSFDVSTLELWAPLLNGGTLAILEPGTPTLEALEQTLRRHGVTTLWLTSGLFHTVVDERLETLRPVRQLLAGGDVLSPTHTARVVRELPDLHLINGYGPTENTTFTTTHRITEADLAGSVPIGRPIANTTVYVLDRGLWPVAVGVVGELYTGGEGVARGYHGRPELTAERFVPDPFGAPGSRMYRTGDLARFLPDGRAEFLGRRDGQVKLRGIRVELGEIEAALNRYPGVQDSVVVVRGEGAADKLLAAYVVPAQEGVSASSLREHLAARLPAAYVPSAFVFLPELPLTPNSKVDRRALPEPAPERHAEDTEPAEREARSPVEEIVAGLFAEVLDLEAVGPEESFFELGGHSLLAMQIVSRVRQSLGVELPLRSLFEAPAPAGLAVLIEQELSAARMAEAPPLVQAERTSRTSPQPLSFAQQRLWLIDRLEPGGAAYNIPSAWRLRGALNVAALAGSLDGIVARHEVLRTRFASVAGEPVQIVAPVSPVPLPVVDLGALAEERRGGELARLAREEARRPFDLEHDLMLRAMLVRLGESDHAALFTVHHIAGDGWSLGVFIRELGELYQALETGRPAELPELPVQYADFAAWQRSWMSGEVLAADLFWWRERLGALPPVLELPADHPRPAVQSYRGATVARELPEELGASLRALARRQGATLFMVLLAGFESLLYRMTSQEAFAVGTPVAGRTRVELEPLIGFFVNTLALPARVEGEESFGGLLQRVREVALEAYARQQIPFEMLVDELHPQRSLSYSPVFQVLFALQNAPLRSRRSRGLSGLELSALAQDTGTAKFDLSLIVSEGRRLTATLEIAADLFEPATARRMLGHLEHLLAGAVADPDRWVCDLPWLSQEEQQEILVEWTAAGSNGPDDVCLHGLFEAQVRRTPDAVALVAGETVLTYAELDARAEHLARRLRELGVGPEERVGVCLTRGADLIVALFAVLKAGGAYVPLDPAYPAERLELMVRDSGGRVLLTQESLLPILPQTGFLPLCLDRLPVEPFAAEPAGRRPATTLGLPGPGNLAYVIYTSGSTGRPKGVAIEHRSAVAMVRWARGIFSDEELSGVLAATSVCFDVSVFEIFAPLSWGGRIVVVENVLALAAPMSLPAGIEVRVVSAVPSAMAELVRLGALPDTVVTLNLGGEPVTEALAEQIHRQETVRRVYNLYGPSEDTTYSTWSQIERGAGPPIIGRPLTGTRAYVLDARLAPVPAGVPGELWLGGEGLSRGYLERPDKTAESFVPDPFGAVPGGRLYRTGDLARWLPGGFLDCLGRIDHQVKIRGFRVELGEIEAELLRHPGVREAAVVAREDASGGKSLVAYVVPSTDVAVHEIQEQLARRLPQHMVPPAFVMLGELPVTPNGKLDRRALPAPKAAQTPTVARRVPPRDELELALVRIWEEVLGTVPGVTEDFFDLGGHSLLAVRLLSLIQERLGRTLSLASLFTEGTVEAQAELLRREGNGMEPAGKVLVPLDPGRGGRPFFCVHPVGGTVFCYLDLARSLGQLTGRPFWALQALDGEAGVPEMAERYVAELLQVQPEGPYSLGGWSMGGLVAFEMARLLRQSGREVDVLALIDPSPADSRDAVAGLDETGLLAWFAQDLAGLSGAADAADAALDAGTQAVSGLPAGEALDALLEWARESRLLPAGSDPALLRHLYQVFRGNLRAMGAYRPGVYGGPLHLLLAGTDGDRGWPALAAGGAEVHRLSADHYSLLREPHVEALAERLGSLLGSIVGEAEGASPLMNVTSEEWSQR